jgi:hypothetical protein
MSDIDKLRRENRSLRERLDKLERLYYSGHIPSKVVTLGTGDGYVIVRHWIGGHLEAIGTGQDAQEVPLGATATGEAPFLNGISSPKQPMFIVANDDGSGGREPLWFGTDASAPTSLMGGRGVAFTRTATDNMSNVTTSWTTVSDWILASTAHLPLTPGSAALIIRASTVSGATFSVRVYDVTDSNVVAGPITGIAAAGIATDTTFGTWPDTSTNDVEIQVQRTAGSATNSFTLDDCLLLVKE